MRFGSRKPKRPLEADFMEAASRLVSEDAYNSNLPPIINPLVYFTIQHAFRRNDEQVVYLEQEAEGKKGDRETLEEFAIRRLKEAQRSKDC